MKVDTYTKIVLTVIAICLTWLCLRNISLLETVSAQAPPRQEVIIAGVKTRDGLLPVKYLEHFCEREAGRDNN